MHIPVLLNEVLEYLAVAPGKKYIDATLGYAGHAIEIYKSGGEVLGIERDPEVVAEAERSFLSGEKQKITVAQGNFKDIARIASSNGFEKVHGILFDLGMGSHQLDDKQRGFAFQKDGPLDMRFDRSDDSLLTAGEIVNKFSEKELETVFRDFGEEKRFGRRVAKQIVRLRKQKELQSTAELFNLIKQAVPARLRFRAGDVARRIFQSLRIKVNSELEALEAALPLTLDLLEPSGRLVAISFHSLEDRIVKSFMVQAAKECVCPPDFPVCRCDKEAELKILTKKPITTTAAEAQQNPRSKSAKLRAAERLKRNH